MRYVTMNGGKATIKVDGRYDLCNTLDVQSEMDIAFSNGCTKITVDFNDTSEIDSAAMLYLLKIRDTVSKKNFKIINAKGKIYECLSSWRLVD